MVLSLFFHQVISEVAWPIIAKYLTLPAGRMPAVRQMPST